MLTPPAIKTRAAAATPNMTLRPRRSRLACCGPVPPTVGGAHMPGWPAGAAAVAADGLHRCTERCERRRCGRREHAPAAPRTCRQRAGVGCGSWSDWSPASTGEPDDGDFRPFVPGPLRPHMPVPIALLPAMERISIPARCLAHSCSSPLRPARRPVRPTHPVSSHRQIAARRSTQFRIRNAGGRGPSSPSRAPRWPGPRRARAWRRRHRPRRRTPSPVASASHPRRAIRRVLLHRLGECRPFAAVRPVRLGLLAGPPAPLAVLLRPVEERPQPVLHVVDVGGRRRQRALELARRGRAGGAAGVSGSAARVSEVHSDPS